MNRVTQKLLEEKTVEILTSGECTLGDSHGRRSHCSGILPRTSESTDSR